MHQRSLRTVLLIQAIEETDRVGEVIPLADRADASRAVVRESKLSDARLRAVQTSAAPPGEAQTSALLSSQAERFLIRRAERLLERLSTRSPAVLHILALAGGVTWLGRFVLLVALAAGISLLAPHGRPPSNIPAFPLIPLLSCN